MNSKRGRTGGAWRRVALVVPWIFSFAAMAPALVMGADRTRVAAFDFELRDTSLEGEIRGTSEAEQRRLAAISDLLRRYLTESGRYEVLDLSSQRGQIDAAGYLWGCNGCDTQIARALGASVSMTGVVQKVSNLILNINISVRDANSGRLLQGMSVDIRGNTDETWSRGLSWLVRNRLMKN